MKCQMTYDWSSTLSPLLLIIYALCGHKLFSFPEDATDQQKLELNFFKSSSKSHLNYFIVQHDTVLNRATSQTSTPNLSSLTDSTRKQKQ